MKERLKVVFMPYKASMWDSLESIWKAALEDEHCDCKVVPIPYYDKKEDASLGQMYYEGALFPGEVCITDYREYDIKKELPDIIYVHNVYDNFNRVTSVHPDYYTEQLKMYTKKLVYVPYFVAGKTIKKEFCILPGLIRADLVMLETEEIKEKYLQEYPGKDREKFIVTGSPKIDKVMSMSRKKREELPIPKEWKTMMKDKKVILYNTHLNHLINEGEQALRKLVYVFEEFSKRKDVVLLWRPHPLSAASMQALNPVLLKIYEELIEQFKIGKMGIFDDTPDVHLALQVADGYYGDRSSLIFMYGMLQRPIMIQDVFLNDFSIKPEEKALAYEKIVAGNELRWVSSARFNGFFGIDEKGEVCEHYKIPEEKEEKRLYASIENVGDGKFLLIPLNAGQFAIFSEKERNFSKMSLDKVEEIRRNKFYAYIHTGSSVYIFPFLEQNVIKYDIQKEQFEILHSWDDVLCQYRRDKYEIAFISVFQYKNKIYAPFANINAVAVFDVETELVDKVINVKEGSEGYSDICIKDDRMYLFAAKECALIITDLDGKETEKHMMNLDEPQEDYYVKFASWNEWLFILFDMNKNTFVAFNTATKEFFFIADLLDDRKLNCKYIWGGMDEGKNIWFYPLATDGQIETLKFNTEKLEFEHMGNIGLSDCIVKEMLIRTMEEECEIYIEDEYMTLETFINAVTEEKKVCHNLPYGRTGNSGKTIHEVVIEQFES